MNLKTATICVNVSRQCLKLEKLQKEGVLQSGDRVKSTRLGSCQVVAIESTHTITVKNQSGKYFRISGLSLGSDVTMLSS